jgi:hypothetical protein
MLGFSMLLPDECFSAASTTTKTTTTAFSTQRKMRQWHCCRLCCAYCGHETAARRGLVGAAAKIQIKGVRDLKCKFQIIVQTFKTGPSSKHHGRDDVFWRPRPKGGDDVFLFSLLETAAKQRQLNRLSAGRTTVHADFVVTLL